MNDDPSTKANPNTNRRRFLQQSAGMAAGAAALAGLSATRAAHAAGDDAIRIALIGCGGRGTGAAIQALQAMDGQGNGRLVAMADAFEDRITNSLERIKAQCKTPDRIDVPRDRQFSGFEGCRHALEADVDLVLLCTPPGFRPAQFEAAVAAGKHVFMEKPVAVDAPGIRKVLAANREAKKKGLAVCVGLNCRHEDRFRESIGQVHEGAIGRVELLRCYCNNAGVWVRERKPEQTEMEYQMRNWYYFNWLCGDHIVEQHVHAIDLANWLRNDHPVKANGMGGRQVRKGKEHGEIFDHHAVEFEYADGSRLYSFCRHMPGCWNHFGAYAHGTKGHAEAGAEVCVDGQEPKRFERGPDGHQTEHDHLFAALRDGTPMNEGDYGATSTMTAILGRMATYSGKVVTWDDAIASPIDLSPERLAWDAAPKVLPNDDGFYPCAIPGVTEAT